MKIRAILIGVATVAGLILLAAPPGSAACHSITFEGDPYAVGEAAGHVTVRVSNNGGGSQNQTVDYRTIDGSARAGSDYEAKKGTLTFPGPPGEVSFNVPIINDPIDEPAQQFTVELSNLGGFCPGAQLSESSATVTITDNDPKPQPSTSTAPTRSSAPRTNTSSTPTPPPTATKTPAASASPSPTPSQTPTPSPTQTAVAIEDEGSGGLSGGAVTGIVAAVIVLGGGVAFFVRRRFLA